MVVPVTPVLKRVKKMKALKLFVAAGLAVAATGAFAETGAKLTSIDNVSNVYGRANVSNVQIAGPVVTRPANEMVVGATTEQGPVAVAIQGKDVDVNAVSGRS
jgi:hypothetical protein